MDQKRAIARFRGRVQGVWFRAFTKQQADLQDIRGWVRNCPDGSVEALFEGEEAAVQMVIAACQQGPPAARVNQTEITWQSASGEFSRFDITR